MKRIKIVSVVIALLLAAIVSGCIVHEEVSPDGKTGKKVLLIFSYHAEYLWVIEETRGVEDILKDKGVETEKFYLDTWKAKVKELQPKVDAIGLFVYHTIKDPEKDREVSMPPEDVLNWTLKNNNLPEFAFFDFTVREGALCGVTLSGYEQGKAAAEIAIEILDGKKPSDIPIKCPEKGNPIVNKIRAEELNITIPTDIVKEVEITDNGDWEKG